MYVNGVGAENSLFCAYFLYILERVLAFKCKNFKLK